MKTQLNEFLRAMYRLVPVLPLMLFTGLILGCDNKETVLEVETPNAKMEVERDPETGETDVEIDREGVNDPVLD